MRLPLPLTALLGLAGLLLTGCIMPEAVPSSAGTASPPDPLYPWTDMPEIVSGVCFEAGWDAVGQVFVLRNETDLLRFYDLVDNSQLCRRPVRRVSFDFSNGRALVGLWSRGRGCTARHEVAGYILEAAARRLTLRMRFITEGACDYDLLRPFWISMAGVDTFDIQVEGSDPS